MGVGTYLNVSRAFTFLNVTRRRVLRNFPQVYSYLNSREALSPLSPPLAVSIDISLMYLA